MSDMVTEKMAEELVEMFKREVMLKVVSCILLLAQSVYILGSRLALIISHYLTEITHDGTGFFKL